jgi:indole-3-glycerol phosphate synthase
MESGGASGLSVLTEPKIFIGSLVNLAEDKKSGSLPVIMKDIIVSKKQIDAARKIGADAVLFIEEIFSKNYCSDLSLDDAVTLAKRMQLEVIVETHEERGLKRVLATDCDIIGINNRDLETFEVNIETTPRLLRNLHPDQIRDGLLIMSESGFENPSDTRRIRTGASGSGGTIVTPHAFLIGTSIMKSDNVRNKVREFVEAMNAV